MTYMLVIHTVEDFAKWKLVFDRYGATRKAKGSKGASVLRNAHVPDQVVAITEWEDMETAENFAESEYLKIAMQKASINSLPVIYYLEEIERTQY